MTIRELAEEIGFEYKGLMKLEKFLQKFTEGIAALCETEESDSD